MAACAALAGCGGNGEDDERTGGCVEAADGVAATFRATTPAGDRPASGALDETVRIICERAGALGLETRVRRSGADRIEVRVDGEQDDLDALTRPAQLAFYDWEPNVFGDANAPVGGLEQAVRAAARRQPRAEEDDIPAGGHSEEIQQRSGGDESKIREHYDRENDTAGLPPGVDAASVPRGVAIVRDEGQYFVIEDDAELSAGDITDPKQEFDQPTDEPVVRFGFTDKGAEAFARLTRRVAERGAATPAHGDTQDRFQRFAIAVDGQILSLAVIDFTANPDGITGDAGAQLNGIGSVEETKDLADNLRIGPLPVRLERVGQ